MGIKEQLEAAQSSFIPLSEALCFVVDKENVDLKTAAKWLLHHNAEGYLTAYSLTNTFNLVELNLYGDVYQEIYTELSAIVNEFRNEWDKINYDVKSLGWLREDFHAFMRKHLDSDNANSQPQEEINQHLSTEDFLLRKQSYFNQTEAACLISGDSAIEVARCENDTNFDKNYSGFISAINFIESCIFANELEVSNGCISRDSLINTLNNKGMTIDGFNDDIPHSHVADTTEQSKLLAENTKLKQRISELEQQLKQSQQAVNKPNTPNDIDLLAYILDSTQEHYAADLALSIQLYRFVYIDKPRQDSHTNRANLWLANNTDYDVSSESVTRIRAITAPLKDWGTKRDRNYFKK